MCLLIAGIAGSAALLVPLLCWVSHDVDLELSGQSMGSNIAKYLALRRAIVSWYHQIDLNTIQKSLPFQLIRFCLLPVIT